MTVLTFRAWLDWALPLGLGELQLLPWQFWRLTPEEFRERLDGFARREDRAWHQIARLGTWMLAPHLPKDTSITVDGLLGRRLRLMPGDPE